MDWGGMAQLITAIASAIGGAVAWSVSRRDRSDQAEQAALETATAWESTSDQMSAQIRALEQTILDYTDRFSRMEADYERARMIIHQQDQRINRKDERIAHLERMLDGYRGAPS